MTMPDLPYAIERASWAPDGKTIFGVVNMGAHSEIFQIDRRGPHGEAAHRRAPLRPVLEREPGGRPHGVSVRRTGQTRRCVDVADRGRNAHACDWLYDSLATDFALPRQEKVTWKGADGVADRRPPLLSNRLRNGKALSARRAAARRTAGIGQVRLRTRRARELRPGAHGEGLRACCGRTIAAARAMATRFCRDVVGSYFNNMHLDVMAGVDAADPQRHRRPRSARGDGLERRRSPDEQADHVHRSLQGRIVGGWRRRTGSRFSRKPTRAPIARRGSAASRGSRDAPIDAFWNNSPLKDVANVRTPTLLFAGENDMRGARVAVGGNVTVR